MFTLLDYILKKKRGIEKKMDDWNNFSIFQPVRQGEQMVEREMFSYSIGTHSVDLEEYAQAEGIFI